MASSGNFSTWNPLRYSSISGITYSSGNCKVETTTGYPTCMNNFAPKTGKWYVEFYNHSNAGYNVLGIVQQSSITKYGSWLPNEVYQKQYLYYSHNGQKSGRNSDGSGNTSSYGSSWGSGNQIIGCALDMDNGKVWWSLNGTFQASGDPAAGSNSAFDDLDTTDGFFMAFSDYNGGASGTMGINCGQDSTFGGAISAGGNADDNGFGDFKYAPPTGFLALCSANLPISADIDPAQTDDFPSKQFNCIAYTGTGSSNAVSGLGFKPDLVVIKNRSGTQGTKWTDSSRGVTKVLQSAVTNAESTDSNGLTAFGSDGFTVGSDAGYNGSSNNIIGWCWRANGGTTASDSNGSITSTVQANTKSGFSIITYTGTGSNATIGHSLSAKPDFFIVKSRSGGTGRNWAVYHSSQGATKYAELDNNGQFYTSSLRWNDTEPTDSLISLGTTGSVNASSENFVCYAWHNVEGYSKFGTYEGTANNEGAFVYTGFRPRLLFIKNSESASPWVIYDGARKGYNPADQQFWDENLADHTSYPLDLLSNGFKLRTSNATVNSAHTWIYGAWGDVPFKYNNTF
jgi:hypothetical protein